MTMAWDAPELQAVPRDAPLLAVDVATKLGLATPAVVEVVRLHLEALDSALSLDLPELLADEVRWEAVRLRATGAPFGPDEVDRAVREALLPTLDEAGRQRMEEITRAAATLGEAGSVADAALELEPGPARTYLDAALSGDRDGAVRVIREAMTSGLDPADIMLGILQPAQHELGRLWESGEISIAHEHYTTAITQLSLSLLYPRLIANRTLLGRSMVATGIGSEAHEVGIRIVTDLMEQAGWRTAFLGTDIPNADVVERAAQHRADVVAISATMTGHLRGVRRLIEDLRADSRTAHAMILVGGRPFSLNHRLARQIGADGWAPGAREALEVCRAWTEDPVGSG